MKLQETLKLQALADLVGDFIRYWGFRKIHGEIWTVIYLSQKALSGAEVVDLLQVSKALVSPALKELEEENLIFLTESENSKTKRYRAQEDFGKIIRGVLNRREKPLLTNIQIGFDQLNGQIDSQTELNVERLEKLGVAIKQAHLALLMLSSSDDMWS